MQTLYYAVLIPMVYLVWSLRYGRRVGPNPWNAKGLEWEQAGSPPVTFNFDRTPVVTQEAYAYAESEPHSEAVGGTRG